MEEKDIKIQELSLTTKLDKDIQDIIDKVLSEDSPENIRDLTELFNNNMRKKDMVRSFKLSGFLEKIEDTLITRVRDNPDDIKTYELLNAIKVVQESLNKTTENVAGIKSTPTIQINQQIINSGEEPLSKDSISKVLSLVNKLIKESTKEDIIEAEVVEDKETDESK